MRIAILGLGAVGTAAARFLARAGHEVIGFEQFHLDHDCGSSYGASRIIRRVYPDPLYAELMDAAYPLWEELERESGDDLLLRCGGFFFGPEDHPEMVATERTLTAVGVPFQRWSAAEARCHLPPFRLDTHEYGIFEPESGLLRASRCVLANARLAQDHSAELREGARIAALEPAADGIGVRVEGETLRFDCVIITAGPWTGALLAPWMRLRLTVTRQQYAHFGIIGERDAFAPDHFPVWIDMAELFYGFPEHDALPGVKVARHVPGPVYDPDNLDREPRDEDNEVLRHYMERRLPQASGPVTYSKVCLYTMTPDEDFIIDRLPDEPRVIFIGGLSGHGFKFTVLLGQIAARLAQDQEPGYDLRRFALSRFNGAALESPHWVSHPKCMR
ncbi:MAG: N-methyl-L-tryptophan oxidase [Armatimonadota bacterium]|nr:N-methyl-L-tryptophan oxidase [Armatimonadota bacterium]